MTENKHEWTDRYRMNHGYCQNPCETRLCLGSFAQHHYGELLRDRRYLCAGQDGFVWWWMGGRSTLWDGENNLLEELAPTHITIGIPSCLQCTTRIHPGRMRWFVQLESHATTVATIHFRAMQGTACGRGTTYHNCCDGKNVTCTWHRFGMCHCG